MTDGFVRRRVLALIAFAVAVLWVSVLVPLHLAGRSGFLDPLEYRTVDLRHVLTGPRQAAPAIVIVAIDDRTLAAVAEPGAGRRMLLARLVRRIADQGARALALDVLLADPGTPEANTELAQALDGLPAVIAAAAVFDPAERGAGTLIRPQPVFGEAAEVGLVNLSTDASGTPRYAPLLFELDGGYVPSLALLAAIAFGGDQASFGDTVLELGDLRVPLEDGFSMPLRFTGPTGTIRTVSAADVLEGQAGDALSSNLVVLGYTASAMGDRFATPFDDDMPGVEVIATAISQLIGGATLRRDARIRGWDAALGAALTLFCVIAILIWPLSRGLPVAAFLVGLSMAVVTVLFGAGLWFSAALPLAAAVPPVIFAGAVRYTGERQLATRSERSAASLRRFQSPALVARIESDPNYLSSPVEHNLVIFFVDLTGFTRLSQEIGPQGTQALLRSFHELTTETVEARGGSLFNYMGDGALAVFGLDDGIAGEAADAALSAALDLVTALADVRLPEMPEEVLSCRIGLHHGPALLSRLGADSHQQVTVSGDSVNLASRLMEVAKTEGAVIVASGEFADALACRAPADAARRREVPIRGRAGQVQILVWMHEDVAGMVAAPQDGAPVRRKL